MSAGWISMNFRCFPMQRFIDPNKKEVAKCEVPWTGRRTTGKSSHQLQKNHQNDLLQIEEDLFLICSKPFLLPQGGANSTASCKDECCRSGPWSEENFLWECINYTINHFFDGLQLLWFQQIAVFFHSFLCQGKEMLLSLGWSASSWWLILANVVRCLNTKNNNLRISIKTNQSVHWGLLELCFSGLTISSSWQGGSQWGIHDGHIISSTILSWHQNCHQKGAYAVIPCNPCNLSTYPIVY